MKDGTRDGGAVAGGTQVAVVGSDPAALASLTGPVPAISLVGVLCGFLCCGVAGYWLARAPAPLRGWGSSEQPPLPPYQLELLGDSGRRSPAAGLPQVELSFASTFSCVLRPLQRVGGPVSLRVFLLRHGELRPWAVRLAGSAAGTFRLRAPVAELPELLPGDTEVIFVLGRVLADAPDGATPVLGAELLATPPAGLQVLRATLHLRSDR